MEFIPIRCRIPDLERERSLEPYQVYEEIEMSKQQYSAYRTGRKIPSYATAKKIAEFFGVPMDDLHTWRKVTVSRKRGRHKTE